MRFTAFEVNDPEVKCVLVQARDLLAAGWCQGSAEMRINGVQCFCALGAISRVSEEMTRRADDVSDYESRLSAARAAITRQLGVGTPWLLTSWNDNPDRTKAEVLDVFDRAIKACQ